MLKITMENIIKNSSSMENILHFLRNELNVLKTSYNNIRIKTLKEDNEILSKQVDQAKKRLIQLETKNDIKQIIIPAAKCTTKISVNELPIKKEKNSTANKEKNVSEVSKSVKKEKLKKSQSEKSSEDEESIHIGRLDMRVGKIQQVEKHPDADSLYVSKINCGDPTLRTVVSGLVKHVPITELQNRKVVVLCNLKPAKMRGILSEAMVMCASSPEAVEVLSPPDNAEPGDFIECAGYLRQPDAQLNPKKKIFEQIAPDLKINDNLEACYRRTILNIPGKGPIFTKSLKNTNIK